MLKLLARAWARVDRLVYKIVVMHIVFLLDISHFAKHSISSNPKILQKKRSPDKYVRKEENNRSFIILVQVHVLLLVGRRKI
jgi:hypothetical protein